MEGNNSDRYTINVTSGQVQFARDVYVNATEIDVLTISAIDQGGLSATATVEVQILNVNSNPVFLNIPNTISVPEDLAPGSTVYVISASDMDLGDVITVSATKFRWGGSFVLRTHRTWYVSLYHVNYKCLHCILYRNICFVECSTKFKFFILKFQDLTSNYQYHLFHSSKVDQISAYLLFTSKKTKWHQEKKQKEYRYCKCGYFPWGKISRKTFARHFTWE